MSDFEIINTEMKRYSPELSERPMIVAANKCDIITDEEIISGFEKHINNLGYKLFLISAATNSGVKELINYVAAELSKLPPIKVFEADFIKRPALKGSPEDITIENYGDLWSLEGEWLERLVQNINFSDYESRMYFDKVLRNAGIYKQLEDMGMQEGDTVSIYNLEFEYVI